MARKTRRANYKSGSSWQPSNRGTALDRKSSINLGSLNVNGWSEVSKNDVESAIEARAVDIFSLIETKRRLDEPGKLKLEGFEVFEACRRGKEGEVENERRGGGLACLVRKSLSVVFSHYQPRISNPDLNYVAAERLWVKYESQHGMTAVCTIYMGFQADDDRHRAWNQGIYEVLAEEIGVLRGEGFRCILQGDFNAWVGCLIEEGGIPGNRTKKTNNGRLFLDFLAENSLVHVNGAVREQGQWQTRICEGLWTRHAPDYKSSSVLDYVVVTSEHLGTAQEMMVDENGVYGGASDHNMLFSRWTDKVLSIKKVTPSKKPGWAITEETDWQKFQQVVQRELDKAQNWNKSLDSLSDALTMALTKGLNEGIGRRCIASGKQKLYPKHIVTLLKDRKQLEKIYKTEKSRFASATSQVPPPSLVVAKDNLDSKSAELGVAKAKFERQRRRPLLNLVRCKSNRSRKRFWEFVSRKTKKSTDIPHLQDKVTKILKHEPGEISDEIFNYLKHIFSGSNDPPSDQPQDVPPGPGDPPGNLPKDVPPGPGDPSGDLPQDVPPGPVEPPVDLPQDIPPGPDVLNQSENIRDHEYSQKYHPKLPKSGNSGLPASDPSGFLDKDFTVAEVQGVVRLLGNCKAAGHDEVVNEAMKNAPESFHHLLTKLFNMVKSRGKVPRAWSRGRVVLVHKKGPESDINNYRPLTVLTSMNATYSKLLNSRLTEVVEMHRLLGEGQNGFRKDRGGTDSAFTLNSVLWKAYAKRKKIHLSFIDLQKAYDSVCRETLWKKLSKLGFGGQFLESLKSLYKGDYVTCEANGVTTSPVYLGRGLRQGCSLSPILFCLYVVDMSRDLIASNLGFKMYKVCISCLFFADDILLVAKDAEGLRLLQNIVQRHCEDLGMTLSVSKSKVMSNSHDVWEIFQGDEVVGCLDKVMEFRYLGINTRLCPSKSSAAMMRRAKNLANKYRGACLRVAYDGPDVVDLALALWLNIALPSVLFGCEVVPFSQHVIEEINRHQSAVGKFTLGLPSSAPNISSTSILGVKPFKEVIYYSQFKYLVRLLNQPDERWSKDALLDHLKGGWPSPYIKYLGDVRFEVGMVRWPRSCKEVQICLANHFMRRNNEEIAKLSLPALEPLPKRARMDHVNETEESQVIFLKICLCCIYKAFLVYSCDYRVVVL